MMMILLPLKISGIVIVTSEWWRSCQGIIYWCIGDEIYDDIDDVEEQGEVDMTDEVDDKDRYIFDDEYCYL